MVATADRGTIKMKHIKRDFGSKIWEDLGGGIKMSKSNFLEHGHVAYQIKGNHGCSNMVEKFWPGTPSQLF